MSELEITLLQNIVKAQGAEIAELRTLVLDLLERLKKMALAQRETFAQQVGSSEDFLDTFYDKSLLAKRREKVRSG